MTWELYSTEGSNTNKPSTVWQEDAPGRAPGRLVMANGSTRPRQQVMKGDSGRPFQKADIKATDDDGAIGGVVL